MKKTLFLSLLWAGMALAAHAQQRVQVGELYYELSGGEATVTYEVSNGLNYRNLSGAVTIPSTITYDELKFVVTSIGDSAFCYCSSLTSVTIPKDVTSINICAFYDCGNLTSVTIPEGVTSIGNWAFSYCKGLTSVIIPKSVTSIGALAFAGCSGLISVTIPEGVASIGNWAFSSCKSLTSVSIPEGVTSIGEGAFQYCSGLTSVSIPESVTYIQASTFEECSKLETITIPDGVTDIHQYAFRGSGLTSLTIPQGVKSIGADAFESCHELATLNYNATNCSFNYRVGWTAIKTLNIGENVKSIPAYAFYHCGDLGSASIPESVTSIGKSAFELCSCLSSVTIPESVTKIDSCAFKGCTSLTSVTIPESVTGIETYAFCDLDTLNYNAVACGHVGDHCWSGIKMVRVGEMVKSFPDGAFAACDSLNAVYYANDFAAWCKLSFVDGKANPLCNGADLYIGDVEVTPELVIPEGLGTIGNYAFYGSHLLSFILPADLEQIDGSGIIDSTELKTMTCYADYPPACTEATFGGVDKSVLLYVPEIGLDDYLRHPVWRSFYNMRPFKKNGLTTPTLSEAITVVGGEVHLNLPGIFEAQVYDLQGRHVLSTTENRFALPQGVYIIKVGDEAVKITI